MGGFFTKRLVEPLPDYGINSHIEHERGERTPLCNAPFSAKRLPVIAPGPGHQFCRIPEMLLESQHLWPDSIVRQNIERLFPIKRIVCLLQINIDLIEWALITPGQALVELGLDCGSSGPPLR